MCDLGGGYKNQRLKDLRRRGRNLFHMFECPSSVLLNENGEDGDEEEELMIVSVALILCGAACVIDYNKFRDVYEIQSLDFDDVLARKVLMFSLIDLEGENKSQAASLASDIRKRANGLQFFMSFMVPSNQNQEQQSYLDKVSQIIVQDLKLLANILNIMVGDSRTVWRVSQSEIIPLLDFFGSHLLSTMSTLSNSSESIYFRLISNGDMKRKYCLAYFCALIRDPSKPVDVLDFETCLCYTCDAARFLDSSINDIPLHELQQAIDTGGIKFTIAKIGKNLEVETEHQNDKLTSAVHIMCSTLNELNLSSFVFEILTKFRYLENDHSKACNLFNHFKVRFYLSENKLKEALMIYEGKKLEEIPVCQKIFNINDFPCILCLYFTAC